MLRKMYSQRLLAASKASRHAARLHSSFCYEPFKVRWLDQTCLNFWFDTIFALRGSGLPSYNLYYINIIRHSINKFICIPGCRIEIPAWKAMTRKSECPTKAYVPRVLFQWGASLEGICEFVADGTCMRSCILTLFLSLRLAAVEHPYEFEVLSSINISMSRGCDTLGASIPPMKVILRKVTDPCAMPFRRRPESRWLQPWWGYRSTWETSTGRPMGSVCVPLVSVTPTCDVLRRPFHPVFWWQAWTRPFWRYKPERSHWTPKCCSRENYYDVIVRKSTLAFAVLLVWFLGLRSDHTIVWLRYRCLTHMCSVFWS